MVQKADRPQGGQKIKQNTMQNFKKALHGAFCVTGQNAVA